MLAAFVSSRIGLGGSGAVDFVSEPLPSLELFVDSPVVFVVFVVVVVLVVSGGKIGSVDDLGVGVCSGIFGGAAFTVVGMPGDVVVLPGVGVPGTVGVLVGGTVAAGGFAAIIAAAGLCLVFFSAAYAATDAPATSTAVAPRIIAPVRQPGPLLRLPGAPAPHCRHQSCAPCIGAPHFAHARCSGSAPG
ncbi:MAG TPA: hypothetical protein VFV03_06235 [Solirubrobacteraceae bacterium]|nr:hypothetical protein [Solirubrobacteraceae bacterium]